MKTLSETKQQRLQKDKTAHMQHQLWKVWDEYRAGNRSVDGVLLTCARIYLSVQIDKRDAADDADDDRRCYGVFVILAPDTNCILTYLLTGRDVLSSDA